MDNSSKFKILNSSKICRKPLNAGGWNDVLDLEFKNMNSWQGLCGKHAVFRNSERDAGYNKLNEFNKIRKK